MNKASQGPMESMALHLKHKEDDKTLKSVVLKRMYSAADLHLKSLCARNTNKRRFVSKMFKVNVIKSKFF